MHVIASRVITRTHADVRVVTSSGYSIQPSIEDECVGGQPGQDELLKMQFFDGLFCSQISQNVKSHNIIFYVYIHDVNNSSAI